MAKQRYINTKFWDDEYISNLDPSEKLLFLYCLTNPATNISGSYEIPLKRIATDTGFDKEMIVKILARFEKDDKIIYRDGWLLIINFIKHQQIKSNTVIKGINENLKDSPQWIKDTLSIRYGGDIIYFNLNLDSNLDLNLDINDNLDIPSTTTKKQQSMPPTLSEVADYITTNNIGLDPQWFIDYYSARGWMVGRYKMKDWQAAVRTCERNRIKWEKEKPPGAKPSVEDNLERFRRMNSEL